MTLHGFTGGPSQWEAIAPGTHLALLGHAPATSARGGESFEGEVERIAAALADASARHLAGYSMGARVALGVALRRPRGLERVTLIAPHPGLADDGERRLRLAAEEALIVDLERGDIDTFVASWEALPMWDSQRRLAPSVLASQRALRRGHDPRQLAAALRALGLARQPNYWPALSALDVPVTLVVGALDAKFTALARDAVERLPLAELVILEGVGHNPLLEAPDTLRELLLEGA